MLAFRDAFDAKEQSIVITTKYSGHETKENRVLVC